MRVRSALALLVFGHSLALAQEAPGETAPPPPPAPPAESAPPPAPSVEAPAPPAPPVAATPSPVAPVQVSPPSTGSSLPPINITITNNNNGNNSNTNTQTNDQTQSNHQNNTQTNNQTVEQTNNQNQTVAPPSTIVPHFAPPVVIERFQIAARRQDNRWLLLGATSDGRAVASFDLLARGAWSIGVSAGGDEHRPDGGAYIAWTHGLGRLDVRALLGVGAGGDGERHRGGHDGDRNPPDVVARTIDPTSTGGCGDHHRGGGRHEMMPVPTAALLVSLPIGKHLGIVAGPTVSGHEASGLAGLRWRF